MPNLNVKYETVYLVYWDNASCGARLDSGTDEFPTVVVFDLEAPSSQPALTFYSRKHIESLKIPEIEIAIIAQRRTVTLVLQEDTICCSDGSSGSCEGEESVRACNADDLAYEEEGLTVLLASVNGWRESLLKTITDKNDAITSPGQSIVDWFSDENVGQKGMYNEEHNTGNMAIKDFNVNLAPDVLIDNAQLTENGKTLLKTTDVEQSRAKIRQTKRIQFSGSSGAYELSLDKARYYYSAAEDCNQSVPAIIGGSALLLGAGLGLAALPIAAGAMVVGSAIAGCNFEIEPEIALGDTEFEGKAFGNGVKGQLGAGKLFMIQIQKATNMVFVKVSDFIFQIDFSLNISHETSYGITEEDSTSVSVSLGDPDIGDEFVIDLYFDKTYGTFIFDTVGGRSKCVHEEGTAPSEDPALRIISSPSPFIFPDEEMVFEIEMINVGQSPDSDFYIAQEAGSRNLPVTIDSNRGIDENGHVIQLYQDKPVIKQITIGRGYLKYEFPLVQLTLKSMCEADMNVNSGKYKTIPLSNTYDENQNQVLKWLQPCPEVHWAGELKRNRMFLFNIESTEEEVKDRLEIMVFNPLQNKGKNFTTLVEERNLENVEMEFGMVGIPPPSSTALTISDDGMVIPLDFTSAIEDTYGFASIYWNLDGVPQGTYEIQIHSKCTSIAGSPAEVKEYFGDTIIGVYDTIRPEQYGRPTPLRNDVLIGEEISVYFTEDMWCRLPYTFEIEVDIIGTNYTLTRDKLHIICAGRKLGFQLDLSAGILVSEILGKEFTVQIGRIGGGSEAMLMDNNKNPMNPDAEKDVYFRKRFANLDLSSASTGFIFSMKNTSCTNASVQAQSDNVRSEIGSIIGIDANDRVKISGLVCQNNSTITANAEITPYSGRRLRKNIPLTEDQSFERKDSTELFYAMRDTLNFKTTPTRRYLRTNVMNNLYDIKAMKVRPSSGDIEKFKSTEEEETEEKSLLAWTTKKNDTAQQLGDQIESTVQKENKLILNKILKEKDSILNIVLKEKDEALKAKNEEEDNIRIVLEKVLKEKNEVEAKMMQILAKLG